MDSNHRDVVNVARLQRAAIAAMRNRRDITSAHRDLNSEGFPNAPQAYAFTNFAMSRWYARCDSNAQALRFERSRSTICRHARELNRDARTRTETELLLRQLPLRWATSPWCAHSELNREAAEFKSAR